MKNAKTTNPKTEPVRFETGDIMVRPDVLSTLSEEDMFLLLLRHERGDWGDIGIRGEQLNERALKRNEKVFSVYEIADQELLLVITDEDRELTYVAFKDDAIWGNMFDDIAHELAVAMH